MPGLLQTFDISSDSEDILKLALAIPFAGVLGRKGSTHYTVSNKDGFDTIEFHSYEKAGATPLPFPLDTADRLFTFTRDWLAFAKRGPQFDTDGHCNRGWRVTQNFFNSVAVVEATWIIYGK